MMTRRKFFRSATALAAGSALASTAKSYARIVGANERVNFAVIGLNGRAYAHLSALHANRATARISHAVDVDSVILARYIDKASKMLGETPHADGDFRRVLESKDVDAITIATPEHWHTPMAILGMQAGKDVYVEKPCSHNLHECELIVAAQKKYGKLVQMGNQQRSSPHTQEAIGKIQSGVVGRPYFAKAWYSNARSTIGTGKPVAVPATLDWELWQGPAPRRPYRSNVHPYNWHWFKIYGTGESLNNGTHEVDVCRWALGVTYPKTVNASGGRYQFKDDWQFYDTMVTSYQYDDRLISWEGMSCNDMYAYDRERGSAIHGTEGTVIIDRDGYDIFDLKSKLVSRFRIPKENRTTSADLIGEDSMTNLHFGNFVDGIRTGAKLHSPIAEASVSVALLLMSNIAIDLGRTLDVDGATGGFLKDAQATAMRSRVYEKGWEPKV